MTTIAEIYQRHNQLKDKISYGSDGVDMATIARAEAVIVGMQGEFIAWFQNDIETLQNRFNTAVALPVEERAREMTALRVSVHDMKGQGGSFGFPLVTNIANTLGQFMDACAEFGPRELEVMRVHIDALRLVVNERIIRNGGRKGEKLLRSLEVVMQAFVNR